MRKQRNYSLFAKLDGAWARLSPLSLKLNDARRIFQGALLSGSMNGFAMELRPAEDDFERKEEYDQNREKVFPKEETK